MTITVEIEINKPISQVWEVMGNQFGEAHLWSSNFKSSKPAGEARFEGLAYSKRDTTTDRGNTIQELTHFDPEDHSLSYVITTGAPEIAQSSGATWALTGNGEQCLVSMEFFLEPKLTLQSEMETKIKTGLAHSVNQLAEELKYYLEEGVAHPRNYDK